MQKVTFLFAVLFSLFPCMPVTADNFSLHVLPPELVQEAMANNPDFYASHYSIPCYRIVGHVCVTKMHWEWMQLGAERLPNCLQHVPSNQQRPCPIDVAPSYAWHPNVIQRQGEATR